MTPEERDRLVAIEIKQQALETLLEGMAKDLTDIKNAAHMGRGMWLFLTRAGRTLLMLFGLYSAVTSLFHLGKP